jgi:hypothetical protein
MYTDMTADEAEGFSKELRTAANRFERDHSGKTGRLAKSVGFEYYDGWTFEDAIFAVRQAARWYEKVANLGFGVRAWY